MLNQALKHDLSLEHQKQVRVWFETLRNQICLTFETIEEEYAVHFPNVKTGKFIQTPWQREGGGGGVMRSEEHTSELQSLMRISYAVLCLKKKNKKKQDNN